MKLWKKVKTEETGTKERKPETTKKRSIRTVGKRIPAFVKRHKVLTIVLVLFLCALAVFFILQGRKKKQPQMEGTRTVETATVEKMDLANSISVTGTIASARTKTGTTSLNNLKVTEVCVEVGDTVQEGDVICRFDSGDIEKALAEAKNNYSVNQQIDALGKDYQTQYEESVEQAEETLQSARDKRDEAKSAYASAAESENAAKTAYENAAADLKAKESAFVTAKEAAVERAQSYEDGTGSGITVNDLDSYIGNLDLNGAAYTACRAELEAYLSAKSAYETAQKAASEAQSAYEKAKSSTSSACSAYEQAQSAREDAQEVYEDSLEKAEETYKKAKLNDQLITENDEEKKIEEYEEQLSDCTVYASMDGVITSLSVEEGETFAGGAIYELQDPEYFIVEASVDEYDIVDIAKGMIAYVKTDSMGDEEMEAEVTFVSPTGTSGVQMGSASSTASYALEIAIREPQERLRAGMTAQVSISLEESRNALAVPYDCVQINTAGESVVYVEENGQRREVVVETGIETDYYTEVISDELKEGMRIYLSTPMLQGSSSSESEGKTEEEMWNLPMGGGMNSNGGSGSDRGGFSGGNRPSGGAPSGGPGGF